MRDDKVLPEWLLVTPEPPADGRFDPFLARIEHALAGGVALIQLRSKHASAESFDELAGEVLGICRRHGARLILNGPVETTRIRADGIHLNSERLLRSTRRATSGSQWVSAACHTRAQLRHAQAIGVDFVTLSPVLPTSSHPGAPTLGWRRFAELVASVQVPVYALGGMTRADCRLARAFGAQGIAGISAFW